ncbi:MAG: DNA polymerase III subunit delta [Clostridiales bacterium]|nr:DNA polymerase III subunit delta [Clostridiales bacterium]
MPLVKELALARDLRNNQIANIYYFFGKDIAMIESFTRRLINKLVPADEQAVNFQKFDGKSFNIESFSDSCEAFPMFSERVAIAVNDLNADSLNAADFKYFTQILQNLPETTTVIIYATGVDLYKSKTKLSDKNQKLLGFCEKNGVACDFALKTLSESGKTIAKKVEKSGCSISKKTSEYLYEKCNGDTVLLNNEINKLCSYVEDGEITNEIVDLLCVKRLEADAFRLATAIVKCDGKTSYEIMDELFSLQTDAFMILSAVSMGFIDLYRAVVAKSCGKSSGDVVRDFAYPKYRSFAVSNAFRDSSNISPRSLRKCIEILSKTDIQIKSLRTDNRLLLEQAVAKMLISCRKY